MEELMYLILGTDADKKRISIVLNEVSNAIYAMDIVAKSYGVVFSDAIIDKLYTELDNHLKEIEKV
nr:MAG TPA: hypothetical protein [Caudoviricetes sp.]